MPVVSSVNESTPGGLSICQGGLTISSRTKPIEPGQFEQL